MHDKLYENQDDWNGLDGSKRTTLFRQYAETLGLDTKKFDTDVASKSVTQKINFDLALGKKLSLSATPTFFLDGEELDSTTASNFVQGDLTAIKAKIDALLKK